MQQDVARFGPVSDTVGFELALPSNLTLPYLKGQKKYEQGARVGERWGPGEHPTLEEAPG